MQRLLALVITALVVISPSFAQDGLNLPTELYILLNEGAVQRYGLGAVGVQTVVGGNQFVLDFAVAPDDIFIAYRTTEGLFIRNMYEESDPQPIEGDTASYPDIRGKGETIAWSPDSTALAYTTFGNGRVYFRQTQAFVDLGVGGLQDLVWSPDGRYLGVGAVGNVWWIFQRENSSLRLVSAIPDAIGIAWLPDGRFYFTPSAGGVFLMDVPNGNSQTLIMPTDTQYFLPHVRFPYLFVLRGEPTQAQFVAISNEGGNIITEERGSGILDITNLRWSPDGAFLIAFSGGVLALVDPISGEGFTLPINSASAFGWGAYQPLEEPFTVTNEGYYLALAYSTGVTQVWQLPKDGTLPETITPAEQSITEFAISGDKKKLAYVSDGKLWYYVVGTSDQLYELATLGETRAVSPTFSVDGNTLYYRDTQANGKGIWYADLTNGQTFPFLEDTETATYGMPRISPSVSAMLVTVNGQRIALVDTNTRAIIDLGAFEHAEWEGSRILLRNQGTLSWANASDLNPVPQAFFETDQRILDMMLLDETTARLLVASDAPSQVQVVDVPFSDGVGVVVNTLGYVDTPKLSLDGAFVGGYTHPNGALVLVRVTDGAHFTQNVGNGLNSFIWR